MIHALIIKENVRKNYKNDQLNAKEKYSDGEKTDREDSTCQDQLNAKEDSIDGEATDTEDSSCDDQSNIKEDFSGDRKIKDIKESTWHDQAKEDCNSKTKEGEGASSEGDISIVKEMLSNLKEVGNNETEIL